jgi:hypothetical protein
MYRMPFDAMHSNNNLCVCAPNWGGAYCDTPKISLNNSVAYLGNLVAGNQTYFELALSKAVSLLTFVLTPSAGTPLVSLKSLARS